MIVTHNMQQATRMADKTAFFLKGELIEMQNTNELPTGRKTNAPRITSPAGSAKAQKNPCERPSHYNNTEKQRRKEFKMSIRNEYESELALVFNKLVKMCQATI